mgnify:FL=1
MRTLDISTTTRGGTHVYARTRARMLTGKSLTTPARAYARTFPSHLVVDDFSPRGLGTPAVVVEIEPVRVALSNILRVCVS